MDCMICGNVESIVLSKIYSKPSGEVDYKIPENKYYREIRQCRHCSIVFNKHDNLLKSNFYSGFYNTSINKNLIYERFLKIISFNYNDSDNKQRTLRIIKFLYQNDYSLSELLLLDIGSGTGVFNFELNKFGVIPFNIDPDQTVIDHIKRNTKTRNAFCGYLNDYKSNLKFDLITLNKVLEHFDNPLNSLKQVIKLLKNNGIIYLELPNATPTLTIKNFQDRAEFNIEHVTIYTAKSLSKLINETGGEILDIQQISDPSGKNTIYCFAQFCKK